MPERFGIHRFTTETYPELKEHFADLASSQSPATLFVTCSDSRVDPSLITHTKPGELFILRNVGNLVPTWGSDHESGAAIEYAVSVLGVERIVICGHSNCGAMNGLLHPHAIAHLPSVATWVEHASPVRDQVASVPEDQRWDAAIQANVEFQVAQLQSYPCVAEAVRANLLVIEGWVYDIGAGHVNPVIEVGALQVARAS